MRNVCEEENRVDLPRFDLVAGVRCLVVAMTDLLGIQPESKGSTADIGRSAISLDILRFRITGKRKS
jgi:hypothetical protein